MMYVLLGLFLFVVAIVISAVVFGAWVLFSVLKLIVCALFGGWGGRKPQLIRQAEVSVRPASPVQCPHADCRSTNPSIARYCRRCGRSIRVAERISARRVAML